MKTILLVPCLLLAACSTLHVNKEETAKVKKVAVVGLSLIQDDPPTILNTTLIGRKDDHTMGQPNAAICSNKDSADVFSQSLESHLAASLNWTVVDPKKVEKNELIQDTMKWEHSNLRQLELIPNHTLCYTSPRIPEAFAIQHMSRAERDNLIHSLNVDAIVVVEVRVELENHSLLKMVGAGEFQPRSTLNFIVYNTSQEDPIWHDTWARGEPTETGTKQFLGFTDNNALDAQVVSSSESAVNELLKKYSEQ